MRDSVSESAPPQVLASDVNRAIGAELLKREPDTEAHRTLRPDPTPSTHKWQRQQVSRPSKLDKLSNFEGGRKVRGVEGLCFWGTCRSAGFSDIYFRPMIAHERNLADRRSATQRHLRNLVPRR